MEQKRASQFWEIAKTLLYACVIALVVRTLAFEPFNIPSGSMIPSLLVGDFLFVSKYSYGYSRFSLPLSPDLFSGRVLYTEPQRGDVAVFKNRYDEDKDYIKRIVGLPGDRISMKGGILHINGKPVQRVRIADYHYIGKKGRNPRVDEFVPAYLETLPGGVTHPIIEIQKDTHDLDNMLATYTVPPDHFFVMGDNRDNSSDSRAFREDGSPAVGFVPKDYLVGRAEMIFLSVPSESAWWAVWDWRFSRMFTLIE